MFRVSENSIPEKIMYLSEEVKTKDSVNTVFRPNPVYLIVDDQGNLSDPLIVDQFEGQDFFRGENGFKRSDIEMIIKSESAELQQMFMQKIGEYPAAANEGKTVSEIVSKVMPRYAQTPVSKRNWLEGQLEKPINDWLAEHKTDDSSPAAAEPIKFDAQDVSND